MELIEWHKSNKQFEYSSLLNEILSDTPLLAGD